MRAIDTTTATIPSPFTPALFDHIDDSSDYRFDVTQYLMIPEPNDSKPLRLEELGSFPISLFALDVLAAIELDDDAHFHATEVSNEWANRHLPPKLPTADLLGAQM